MNIRTWLSPRFALLPLVLVVFRPAPSNAHNADVVEDDLSGRWIMKQVTRSAVAMPIVGDVTASTETTALLNLRQEGSHLYGKGILCHVQIRSGTRMIKSHFGRNFLSYAPRPTLKANVIRKDGKLVVSQPRSYLTIGATQSDDPKFRLPTSPTDPDVVDMDRDGKPGVTLYLRGLASGEVYFAQRMWYEFDAYERSTNYFRGKMRFSQKRNVLDAKPSILVNAPDARPLPSRSFVELKRIPKKETCQTIAKRSRK